MPPVYNVDPERTRCAIKEENWADTILLHDILLDNNVFQVMGSYALAAVNPTFTPNDCDVFVTASDVIEFQNHVAGVLGRLERRFDDGRVNIIASARTQWLLMITLDFENTFLDFQFIWIDSTKYNHVQVCNMFDITCCMFRMVKENGNLCVYANNEYVRYLTLYEKRMNVYTTRTSKRCKKYLRRGFDINMRIYHEKYSITDVTSTYGFTLSRKKVDVAWLIFRFIVKIKIALRRIRYRIYIPGNIGFKMAQERFLVSSLNQMKISNV